MSALIQIKGLILGEMKLTNPALKKAIVNVINAIDTDLNIRGYEQSSDVDDALADLDKALIEVDESNNQIETEDTETPKIRSETPDEGYRDLTAED